ncbi:uncharacterized protein LOC132265076 isoform X1 [Phlebotomus argentipes]|uniref:uncharacterized protein LOC132265076 isoform X1 n=1 Tax=Phlebotomus argentipes TaxID=94469 RepID=UPI002892E506|nr:uncharacterized protein LOC132265076 isoform X1 [Phlebotomus argentipes]XP_059621518.1 uncharacterized protein LOC132265076 isoform X1 [Phlebotomus argentipes]XP_059621519.1 uncharacterized protein LOC132265076 isoform X1 [Phlebotomus argentipes]XP_059621520.1 uncharacterized protein LOC132265076 isoform X1 [Phlebotomus argentipes]XP_059621521.1 uncharacterized protein LOC132265076 isoform X1 [Phlebotomus argentipes]XP_059621522.1 uncharacterized protein LOC132265076 isoform X1 [Phlebotomus
MFVMLSVRTSTVCERQAETGSNALDTTKYNINSCSNNKNSNSGTIGSTSSIKNNNIQEYQTTAINNILNINSHQAVFEKHLTKSSSATPLHKDDIILKPSLTLPEIGPPATAHQVRSNLVLTELNNFKQAQATQGPVATILNDLSPVPAPARIKNKTGTQLSPMTLKGLQTNTPDAKAMRYYRLWIYTCNAVLLMAVIVFCGVAGKVLLADYKRLLVHGLNLGQPSFVYAYFALLVQSGFLQLVGCLGALRLSEKLLNAYWLLLLVLLIGDAILGIFWMFKFERVMTELQPMLSKRLATEYGNSLEFSDLWDRLQNDGRCCGVTGPQDYSNTPNRSYPISCCSPDVSEQITVSRRPLASPVVFRSDELTTLGILSRNNYTDMPESTWSHIVSAAREESKSVATCRAVYQQGCIDKVIQWLKSTADILFVLGYCVIAFLKLCFLGILRYEIKEMIQKIKLLQTEMAAAILCADAETTHLQPPQPPLPSQQISSTSINGGIHAEPKVGNRDRERTRIGSGESERESLLVHDITPKYNIKHKQLFMCTEQQQQQGVDSDTNSGCALIVEDTGGTQAKTINGNNNYELSEFDSKTPTYRLLNAPTVTKI